MRRERASLPTHAIIAKGAVLKVCFGSGPVDDATDQSLHRQGALLVRSRLHKCTTYLIAGADCYKQCGACNSSRIGSIVRVQFSETNIKKTSFLGRGMQHKDLNSIDILGSHPGVNAVGCQGASILIALATQTTDLDSLYYAAHRRGPCEPMPYVRSLLALFITNSGRDGSESPLINKI